MEVDREGRVDLVSPHPFTKQKKHDREGGSHEGEEEAASRPPEAVSIFVSFRCSHSLGKFHWPALSRQNHIITRVHAVITKLDTRVFVEFREKRSTRRRRGSLAIPKLARQLRFRPTITEYANSSLTQA